MKTDSAPPHGMELTKADIALWKRFDRANVRSEMKRILFPLLSHL
jgi:hypothetical protein